MYLGNTGPDGLMRLIEAVLEVPRRPRRLLLDHPSRARYVIEATGTGVSLDPHGPAQKPYLDELMNRIHVGVDSPPTVSTQEFLAEDSDPARFEQSRDASPALAFARAFSERLAVASTCRGKRGRIACERGVVVEPLQVEEVSSADELQIDMALDPTIFSVLEVGPAALAGLVRDVANRRQVPIELRYSLDGHAVRFVADRGAG